MVRYVGLFLSGMSHLLTSLLAEPSGFRLTFMYIPVSVDKSADSLWAHVEGAYADGLLNERSEGRARPLCVGKRSISKQVRSLASLALCKSLDDLKEGEDYATSNFQSTTSTRS